MQVQLLVRGMENLFPGDDVTLLLLREALSRCNDHPGCGQANRQ
jgi:hypothetical protein